MLNKVATTNLSLDFGDFTVTSYELPSSDNFKCGGFPCYAGTLTVQLNGITDAEGNVCASGQINIVGSSQYVIADNGSNLVLEGDKGSAEFTFVNPETEITISEVVTATISNAGQSEVKAA